MYGLRTRDVVCDGVVGAWVGAGLGEGGVAAVLELVIPAVACAC